MFLLERVSNAYVTDLLYMCTCSNVISEVISEGTLQFDAENVTPSVETKRSDFDLQLISRGELAGLLKFQLRF
jgi:hypothetical protein